VALKIPQGGHSVIAAVTAASLTLVGAAGLTMVLETPLTQALAAAEPLARPPAVFRMAAAGSLGSAEAEGDTPARDRLARCACNRWRSTTPDAGATRCAVDELVVSQDWVVARLDLHGTDSPTAGGITSGPDASARPARHAVEVMHLIDGHVDEDWHLASTHDWR
jgi:hypothetical protein